VVQYLYNDKETAEDRLLHVLNLETIDRGFYMGQLNIIDGLVGLPDQLEVMKVKQKEDKRLNEEWLNKTEVYQAIAEGKTSYGR
jgi:hypothetical protein